MPLPVPGQVAEALRRSTVQIITGDGRRIQGNGSGVVLDSDRVITNAHVVRGTGPNMRVSAWDGRPMHATVLRMDAHRDLALLSVTGLSATPASLGDSRQLKPGAAVVAVGNPFGFVGAISSGVVHAIGPIRPYTDLGWVQADVRLAPGNSGGPLADYTGAVVGINTMIVTGGVALAIPSRSVQLFLTTGASKSSLGISARPIELRDGSSGIMLLQVNPGGAAHVASLMAGDILKAANGRRFESIEDLQELLTQSPGTTIQVQFYRGGVNQLRQTTIRLSGTAAANAAAA